MRRMAVCLVTLALSGASPAIADLPTEWHGSKVRFEGDVMDLRQGWGDATACLVHPSTVECFRTEAEMLLREAQLAEDEVVASCSSPLRLYDGSSQSGDTVSIWVRWQWKNLGTLGFNNRTSSYIVGACSVELAAGTSGGGSRYPRCLYAGCREDTMASGWNNTISSVYLN